jgi:hypothetical protein
MSKKKDTQEAGPPDPDLTPMDPNPGPPPLLELEPPPEKFETRIEWFDPARFDEIIKASSDFQRDLSETVVRKYARDMRTGHWIFNGAPIQFDGTDENGIPRMTNGFHRGYAVILANVKIAFVCQYSIALSAIRTMDNNRVRSLAAQLKLDGKKNSRVLAKLLTYLGFFRLKGAFTGPRLSMGEYFDLLADNPGTQLIAKEYDLQLPRNLDEGLAACAHYLCAEQSKELAEHFFDQIVHGVNLETKDPARIFREWCINLDDDQYRAARVGATLIACWNKECKGEKITKVPNVKRCPPILAPAFPSV